MEEFSRKRTYNDALLMRLGQLGICWLRSPPAVSIPTSGSAWKASARRGCASRFSHSTCPMGNAMAP